METTWTREANDAKFILAQLGDTKESIDNIKTTAAQLETYVKLFKLPVAEYQNLTDAVELYETRMKLWTMVDKFNDDTDGYPAVTSGLLRG